MPLIVSGDTITRCRCRRSASPYESYATRGYDFRSRQKRPLLLSLSPFLPCLSAPLPHPSCSSRCVSRYARRKTRRARARARICAPCDNPDVPKRCIFSLRLSWDFLRRSAAITTRTSGLSRFLESPSLTKSRMSDLTESRVCIVLLFCVERESMATNSFALKFY